MDSFKKYIDLRSPKQRPSYHPGGKNGRGRRGQPGHPPARRTRM